MTDLSDHDILNLNNNGMAIFIYRLHCSLCVICYTPSKKRHQLSRMAEHALFL